MVNWTKVLTNAGVAFATTLAGLVTFDSLFGAEIGLDKMLIPALIVAGIQGFLAFCVSAKQEAEVATTGKNCDKKGTVNYITLF